MIPYGKHHLDEQDLIAVREVLSGNSLTQGPAIESFEEALAAYVGAKFAVAVSSGTAALHFCFLLISTHPSTHLTSLILLRSVICIATLAEISLCQSSWRATRISRRYACGLTKHFVVGIGRSSRRRILSQPSLLPTTLHW